MFDVQTTVLTEDKIVKYQILKNNRMLSFKEVIQLWATDDGFNDFFNETLAASSFSAFFWEMPPLTSSQLKLPFEFVLVKSKLLANIPADVNAFRYYFSTNEPIVNFGNLGGDALLVVPVPISEHNNYAHIAGFVRNVPLEQKRALWKTVAKEYEKKLRQKPIWLSTAGLGVSWLHVRIDDRPKYYRYQAYRGQNYFSRSK